jgi:hypothetical protein
MDCRQFEGPPNTGPRGVYRIFNEGDYKEMGHGRMVTKAPHIPLNGPMQVPGEGAGDPVKHPSDAVI